jgi:hypothetical protein
MGVAAKELGRFFAGAEREREYAELAARRIGAAEREVGSLVDQLRRVPLPDPFHGLRPLPYCYGVLSAL